MKNSLRFLSGRRPHLLAAALLLVLLSTTFADDKPGVPAAVAMARLKAGNDRFVLGRRKPVYYPAERTALVKGQKPYAILLTCSDSRVPPELVFDESLGKIFIARVAGNVADPVTLGSIEYAVLHFGTRLLVVLGHESCGAVEATLDGDHVPPNIEVIVRKIQPAADRARDRGLDPKATMRVAVEENVRQQIHDTLAESEILRERVGEKSLTIVGGVYWLATGRVQWLADVGAPVK
jgi:carbonic anhydrase